MDQPLSLNLCRSYPISSFMVTRSTINAKVTECSHEMKVHLLDRTVLTLSKSGSKLALASHLAVSSKKPVSSSTHSKNPHNPQTVTYCKKCPVYNSVHSYLHKYGTDEERNPKARPKEAKRRFNSKPSSNAKAIRCRHAKGFKPGHQTFSHTQPIEC